MDRNLQMALEENNNEIKALSMRELFQADKLRSSRYTVSAAGLTLDYSRQKINDQSLHLFAGIAKNLLLTTQIDALFNGQTMNNTENRAALHMALRDQNDQPIYVNNQDIKPAIHAMQANMRKLAEEIISGQFLSVTDKPFTDIVLLGIGGSLLGPLMTIDALSDYRVNSLRFHVISTLDEKPLDNLLSTLPLDSTLFIIASKSFTTFETLTNANTILSLLQQQFGPDILAKQFIAITEAHDKARHFGIPATHILPIWSWVGGRFSIWSSVGFSLMLIIGVKHYEAFLNGAFAMDQHFRTVAFSHNMPMIMACLSFWSIQFFGAKAEAIIPYSEQLRYFIPYLQQLSMESLGKSVSKEGKILHYQTGEVVFGLEGCNSQHTFFQLLHQGTPLIPIDFILINEPATCKILPKEQVRLHHQALLASAHSQAEAFAKGQTLTESIGILLKNGLSQQEAENLAPHLVIAGNKPCNLITLAKLDPFHLGALIALYEHKIFTESVLWDINPFDQWGVELGKRIMRDKHADAF